MAETDQERTEEATQTRREEFRRRGQVAQTRELASVLSLLTMALVLWFLGRFFLMQISDIFSQTFQSFVVTAARSGDYVPAVIFCAKKGFIIVAPLLGILGIMSVASTVLQVGILNNEEAMQAQFERLNPIEGMKKIFSMRALNEGLKAIAKLILISFVAYLIVKDQIFHIPELVNLGINQLVVFMGTLTVRLLAGVGLFMAVLAGLDYFFQRWELEKQMRMTKQEIKEEHKSREGDPLIKARIRRVQREMANKRMMQDVPKADVVITNPTHIAIALRYDPEKMAAPKLLAKGSGLIAEKIKQIARDNSVPIIENKPLARTIFKTLKIGHTIPRELFTAVAQVLSYVYRLRKRKMS